MRPRIDCSETLHGYCPVCNNEVVTKDGDYFVCKNAHPLKASDLKAQPRGTIFDFQNPPKPNPVYGYCPMCNCAGSTRERRPNGYDRCENGHSYTSARARPKPIGYFCPTEGCNSIRVSQNHVDDTARCASGHQHETHKFRVVELETK